MLVSTVASRKSHAIETSPECAASTSTTTACGSCGNIAESVDSAAAMLHAARKDVKQSWAKCENRRSLLRALWITCSSHEHRKQK